MQNLDRALSRFATWPPPPTGTYLDAPRDPSHADPDYRPHPHGMSNREFSDWHNQEVDKVRDRDSSNLPAFARAVAQAFRAGSAFDPQTLATWIEDGRKAIAQDPFGDPELVQIVEQVLQGMDVMRQQPGKSLGRELLSKLDEVANRAQQKGLDAPMSDQHLARAIRMLGQMDYDDEDGAPCPMCGEMNQPMGSLGQKRQYNCRACGMWYSNDRTDTFDKGGPTVSSQHDVEPENSMHVEDGRDLSVGGPEGPRHDGPPRM